MSATGTLNRFPTESDSIRLIDEESINILPRFLQLNSASFLKYFFIALFAQLFACALIWIAAFMFEHALDPLFENMVFFYWPTTLILSFFLNTSGESAMFAIPICGMCLGMVAYSAIFGMAAEYLKSRTRKANGIIK